MTILSFIVSTKNNASTIKFVIHSICLTAIHLRTKCNVATELILVDGMSKDGTIEKASKEIIQCENFLYRVRILQDPGLSLSFSREIGLRHSVGDIVVFLDGDIILSHNFATNICKYIRKINEWGALMPYTTIIPLKGYSGIFNMFATHILQRQFENMFPRIVRSDIIRDNPFWSLLSRFWGEDRLLLQQLKIQRVRRLFAQDLVIYKYEEPSFINYWHKHIRYGEGMCKDLNRYAKRILLKDIVLRRLSYIDIILPLLSLYTSILMALTMKNLSLKDRIVNSIKVSLLRYLIRLAMIIGDIKGCILK